MPEQIFNKILVKPLVFFNVVFFFPVEENSTFSIILRGGQVLSGHLIKYKKLAREWTETVKYINDPLSGRTWNDNKSVTHKINNVNYKMNHSLFQLVSQR